MRDHFFSYLCSVQSRPSVVPATGLTSSPQIHPEKRNEYFHGALNIIISTLGGKCKVLDSVRVNLAEFIVKEFWTDSIEAKYGDFI